MFYELIHFGSNWPWNHIWRLLHVRYFASPSTKWWGCFQRWQCHKASLCNDDFSTTSMTFVQNQRDTLTFEYQIPTLTMRVVKFPMKQLKPYIIARTHIGIDLSVKQQGSFPLYSSSTAQKSKCSYKKVTSQILIKWIGSNNKTAVNRR